MRPILASASLVAALALSGCAGYRMIAGGITSGVGHTSHGVGAVVDAEQAMTGPPVAGARSPIGFALNLHGKIVDRHVQVGPSLALRVLPVVGVVMPFAGLGVRLIQLDFSGDGAGVGIFSPYADLGTIIGLSGRSAGGSIGSTQVAGGLGIVVHLAGGYDVWLHDLPNSWWVSASLGLAAFFGIG